MHNRRPFRCIAASSRRGGLTIFDSTTCLPALSRTSCGLAPPLSSTTDSADERALHPSSETPPGELHRPSASASLRLISRSVPWCSPACDDGFHRCRVASAGGRRARLARSAEDWRVQSGRQPGFELIQEKANEAIWIWLTRAGSIRGFVFTGRSTVGTVRRFGHAPV